MATFDKLKCYVGSIFLRMKSSRDYVDRWLGLSVYKAEVDDHGVETHIQGKVIRYSSSSKHFSLLYMDGSSDEVPVDEIEDYLPLRLQFKEKKYRNKRRAETLKTNTVQSPTKRPRLSVSVAGKTNPTRNEPMQADKLEVMSRFVQDTLWALTMVLDVSEEKQQALLSTLNTRNEQPIAALQQYAKEGGLDALHETLRECAREKVVAGKAETNTHQSAPGRKTFHATQDSRSKRTPHVSAHRGRCDKHLRELFHGSFSPRPAQPEEQHVPRKPEPRLKSLLKNPNNAPVTTTMSFDSVPTTQGSKEEEVGCTRRRLRFSRTASTIHFDKHASVRVFRLQVKRAKHKRMQKSLSKSVLKPSPKTITSLARP